MDKKEFPKRGQLRLPSYDYAKPGAYFITVCTRIREQDILGRVVAAVGDGLCAVPPDGLCAVPPDSFPCPAPPATVRLTEIGQIVDKAIRDIPALYTDVSVDTYCVMPDHIHLLVVEGGAGQSPTPTGYHWPHEVLYRPAVPAAGRAFRAWTLAEELLRPRDPKRI